MRIMSTSGETHPGFFQALPGKASSTPTGKFAPEKQPLNLFQKQASDEMDPCRNPARTGVLFTTGRLHRHFITIALASP
jgi:hypothetical protein